MKFNLKQLVSALLIAMMLLLAGCGVTGNGTGTGAGNNGSTVGLDNIPPYSGEGYIAINDNVPFFTEDEVVYEGYYTYSELDSLGRCGVAMGCIGTDTMPTTPRESISHITPSGWKHNGVSNNKTYPELIGQSTVYNRSHLFANQLVDRDVDVKNLITGTRYMNQIVMKDFENMVADYIKETGLHVMYRVTPVFEGNNLVASGVLMEALSAEDGGDGICFCVYLYNVEPGVEINYLTGENRLASSEGGVQGGNDQGSGDEIGSTSELTTAPETEKPYILSVTANDVTYYFAGAISTKKTLTTTTDVAEATAIYFESSETDGSYYIYFMKDGAKSYINMTTNATTAFSTVDSASKATAWTLDFSKKQVINGTHSTRALAFYGEASDIRTYATSKSNPWVWVSSVE